MEENQDKENVKAKSRIPLPLAPLPSLPKHLLKRSSERPPLNTLAGPNGQNNNVPSLNSLCVAGPSNSKNKSQKDGIASTPPLNTLVPARVKNIKRSLKRPHSRELQRLTPPENRETVNDRAKRRLKFNQSVCERMQSPDLLQKSYMASLDKDYLSEILSYLLQAEKKQVVLPLVKSETRACVINWLMKINGIDGKPATIQSAVWYLDAVLASGVVSLENMQLVGAAAYWIATKLHGPFTSASKLVKYADHAFMPLDLLDAEKVILLRLKFPRQPIVPHDYICYFAWLCNKERPGELEVAATFVCLCGMMANKSLCSEYPSVVAAASVRNALMLLKKKELIQRLQRCAAYVAATKKAVNLMQTCAILRHAVRLVAAKNYNYKFIYEQYGMPPTYIAQTLASAANELAVIDTRTTTSVF